MADRPPVVAVQLPNAYSILGGMAFQLCRITDNGTLGIGMFTTQAANAPWIQFWAGITGATFSASAANTTLQGVATLPIA